MEAGAQATKDLYERGADIVFLAAGSSGYGGFEAARELSEASGRQLWVIGADSDQYEKVTMLPGVVNADGWRRHILTSVEKRWDRATYSVLEDYVHGSLRSGVTDLDLKSEGVDISYSGGFLDDIRPRLEVLRSQIVAGTLGVPCVPVGKSDAAATQEAMLWCKR